MAVDIDTTGKYYAMGKQGSSFGELKFKVTFNYKQDLPKWDGFQVEILFYIGVDF